jgi:hypothetical protein
MQIGNVQHGVMQNKHGWKDLSNRYLAATGLKHDKEQLQGRLRQLRTQWTFCNTLRKASGLGQDEEGNVTATEKWWKDHTKVKGFFVYFSL